MCEFQFAVPSVGLIEAFDSSASPVFERGMLAICENKALADLRDTLLPKLISGELQIPDAEKFLEEAGI